MLLVYSLEWQSAWCHVFPKMSIRVAARWGRVCEDTKVKSVDQQRESVFDDELSTCAGYSITCEDGPDRV